MFSGLRKHWNKLTKRLVKVNKFTLVGVAFVIWVSFFDKHSLLTQFKLSRTVASLEQERENYVDQLEVAIKEKADLENNKEKFAREKYLFHKENEEIIIIQNEEK